MSTVSKGGWRDAILEALGPGSEVRELPEGMRTEIERLLRLELVGRQIATFFSYSFIQFGCLWFTSLGRDHPVLCGGSAWLNLLAGVVRFYLGRQYVKSDGKAEGYYRLNRGVTLAVAGSWSAFVFYAVCEYGFGEGSLLPLLGSASALMGSAGALSPDLGLGRPFVCIICVPLVVLPLIVGGEEAIALGYGGMAGMASVMVLLNHMYRALVSGKIALLRLERHTAELNAAKDVAEQATVAKSMFLANMSHEIRTPLTGVLGLTNLLAETTLDPKQKDLLAGVRSSGEMLLALVNDVLDFSKIAAGKMEIHMAPVHLRELAGEVVAPFRRLAATKGVAVRLIVDSSLPQWVEGDPVRIRQILSNLIGNAVKFTSEGAVTVKIAPERSGGAALAGAAGGAARIRFAVKDTGPGMNAETAGRLFREFSQADGSTTRKFGGTGLGLAISKRLVELMRGEIGVESILGQGSLFWFGLPMLPASAPPMATGTVQKKALTDLSEPLHILIAEDTAVNQIILRNLVAKMGHLVTVVGNGRLAYEAVKREQFDLILMDWQMPEMDALEATAAIRQLGERGQLPIIAVTANAFEEDRERCLAGGMNDHVAKPIRVQELERAIRRWAPVDQLR